MRFIVKFMNIAVLTMLIGIPTLSRSEELSAPQESSIAKELTVSVAQIDEHTAIKPFVDAGENFCNILEIIADDFDLLFNIVGGAENLTLFRKHFFLCFHPGYNNFINKKTSDGLPLETAVIEHNNKIVGFVSFYLKEPTIGWINMIGVSKEHRGKGYAQVLMKYAMDALYNQAGVTEVGLYVKKENIPAQTLYKKLGFIEDHSPSEALYVYKHTKPVADLEKVLE